MKQHDKLLLVHVFPPLMLTLLFFVNAALPISTVGCVNRGLIAVFVALLSVIASIHSAIMVVKRGKVSAKGQDAEKSWWIISTLLFLIPVIGFLLLA
jgi:uncharacterized membrane protein YhaH (DUF805 family)